MAEPEDQVQSPIRPAKSRRRMLIDLILVAVLLIVWFVVGGRVQDSATYHPARYDPTMRPGEGRHENFRPYTAADGREHWGYLIEPSGPADMPNAEAPRPGFYIVLGGNASTAMGGADFYEGLASRTGCGFFIVDYRGFGFNEGRPTESGLIDDAVGAYDTLKADGHFADADGVGVIGTSLGGAVALALVESRPVDSLILISTFTSIREMAREVVPWPISLIARNRWRSEDRLEEIVSRPEDERPRQIWLLHGRRDEVIPYRMGEQLAATAGDAATFIALDRAAHNDAENYALPHLEKILRGVPLSSP